MSNGCPTKMPAEPATAPAISSWRAKEGVGSTEVDASVVAGLMRSDCVD